MKGIKMQEVWRPIPNYETVYAVSNKGQIKALSRQRRGVSKKGKEFIRNMPEKILKPCIINSGYLSLSLTSENGEKAIGFLVHRVVASAFCKNPKNDIYVNHKDGNKLNNSSDNLEWCSPSYNVLHALSSGLMPRLFGSDKGTAKLNEDKVFVIKKMILLGFSNKELASIFKVSAAPISYIRSKKAWNHVPW